jgi:precorrin isomerase
MTAARSTRARAVEAYDEEFERALVNAITTAITEISRAIRKTCDELHKRLRRRVAHATADPELQDFLARVFRSSDVEGHA